MNHFYRRSVVALALLSTASLACSSSSIPAGNQSGADASTPAADAGAPAADAGAPGTDAGANGTDGSAPRAAVAFFRGILARPVADSKAYSDPFFTNVEADAKAAGDNGHDALLGTTDLGTTLSQFVGLDTWSSDTNMDAVYSDPHVQSFGASFYASPPEFKTFYASTFYQWGNTDSGDQSTPHYFVAIRGRFANAPDAVKGVHDPILQGAEPQYQKAGGVAHIVYYGRQDPKDALMIDIWTSRTNIVAFYSDAQFKSALSSLFDATGPNFGVYGTTDWVTW
jgi:hypothetical protein